MKTKYYAIVQEFKNSYVILSAEAETQEEARAELLKKSFSGIISGIIRDYSDGQTDESGVIGQPLTEFEFNRLAKSVSFLNPTDTTSIAYESEYFGQHPQEIRMVNLGVYPDRVEAIAKNPEYAGVVIDGLEAANMLSDFRSLRTSA